MGLLGDMDQLANNLLDQLYDSVMNTYKTTDKALETTFRTAINAAANQFYSNYTPTTYERQWDLYEDNLAVVKFDGDGLLKTLALTDDNLKGVSTGKGRASKFSRVMELGKHGYAKTDPLSPPPIDLIEMWFEDWADYFVSEEDTKIDALVESVITKWAQIVESMSEQILDAFRKALGGG